jgi:hypothetical protein
MEDEKQPIYDWVHLPIGIQEESLWECLHDAQLIRVASDRLEHAVELEFRVGYLSEFHKLPEELTFNLRLCGVQSVRVAQSVPWPGEFSVPQGTSRPEETRLIDEYQAKWREESVSWPEFEARLASSEDVAEVMDAACLQIEPGQFALRLLLCIDPNYPTLFLRSESAEVARSDGQPTSLAEFLKLGEDYWEAFAARGRARRAGDAIVPKE